MRAETALYIARRQVVEHIVPLAQDGHYEAAARHAEELLAMLMPKETFNRLLQADGGINVFAGVEILREDSKRKQFHPSSARIFRRYAYNLQKTLGIEETKDGSDYTGVDTH